MIAARDIRSKRLIACAVGPLFCLSLWVIAIFAVFDDKKCCFLLLMLLLLMLFSTVDAVFYC